MQMWLLSMWICGPLSKAPPLSSPLHPSSWQRLQTAFSHAFPKSRYVDSIRLTSHNGEFVQQEELHYLNPSVALPLFEICGLDWHGLPSVSFMDRQKVNSSAPFEVHKTWLSSIDARFTLSLQNVSIPPQLLPFFWPTLFGQRFGCVYCMTVVKYSTILIKRLRPCGWMCADFSHNCLLSSL